MCPCAAPGCLQSASSSLVALRAAAWNVQHYLQWSAAVRSACAQPLSIDNEVPAAWRRLSFDGKLAADNLVPFLKTGGITSMYVPQVGCTKVHCHGASCISSASPSRRGVCGKGQALHMCTSPFLNLLCFYDRAAVLVSCICWTSSISHESSVQ